MQFAEYPYKVYFNKFLEEFVEFTTSDKLTDDYRSFISKHNLSKRFASRLSNTSLAKIPNPENQHYIELDGWTMRIVVRDFGFQTDLDAYKQYAETTKTIQSFESAATEFQMQLNDLFAHIAETHEYLKRENPFLEYFSLLFNPSGSFILQAIDYPDFLCKSVLAVEIIHPRGSTTPL